VWTIHWVVLLGCGSRLLSIYFDVPRSMITWNCQSHMREHMIRTQDQIERERERERESVCVKKQRGSCTDADQKVSFNYERCSSSLSVLAGYIYINILKCILVN
jgi:hypothetical protein